MYYYRVCGRRSFTGICEGVNYTTGSGLYDQVCGKIIGYQVGCPGAFWFGLSINTYYVDGISVTHGFPRQHIWTFAAGVDETCVIDQDVEYRSTHVLLGVLTPVDNVVLSMQTVTPCVMDRVVVPILHVVYSTHNHGSMYNCLPLQLMRLKFGFVEIYNEDSPIQLTELYVK